MRTIIGIAIGLTATILAYTLWQPALGLIFNRDTPTTPADWTPKMRTWNHGVIQ